MDKFQTLLQKARDKGYKSLHLDSHFVRLGARIMECMFISVWLRVKTKTDLQLVFIDGIEPEEQIDMMLEEIEKM